jgi:hypothetical protein
MEKETSGEAKPSAREFVIPVGLLKMFQGDVRIQPVNHHTTGYIMFDLEMLVSVLKEQDLDKRMALANQIQNFSKAGGNLIMLQR